LFAGIAGGTFEQVTVRLGFCMRCVSSAYLFTNDARAIDEASKSMTSFLLHPRVSNAPGLDHRIRRTGAGFARRISAATAGGRIR